MAYPIVRGISGRPDGNVMAAFLKFYPRKTKGAKSKSQRARSKRRK